ncbi:glycosyltransferase family 2 protein [Bifidobacterium boum]|uniref:Glycosyltransferase n=1 Tax=Bifidobacterium boum TaxID=78343 RepID=A0A086ZLR7_9BIFI|nr:glycosyltransferase family 2 protein [Bifidobacterium boum]KFI47467.1 glycosyltransferase [Bifidobacterium boum]
MISAGIVTYNPDLVRLRENIESVKNQVEKIFIVDNASKNIQDIRSLSSEFHITLYDFSENRGIAAALNKLVELSRDEGYGWMLLLDQDSVSTKGMVEKLSRHIDMNVGIVSPNILDRNKEYKTKDYENKEVTRIKTAARKSVITSGSLTNLHAWDKVGGFDENMFIDYVDYDFNERLLLNDYKILKVNAAELIHECGSAKRTWLWTPRKESNGQWRLERFYSFGHSPKRCYYKARNRIYYSRKYWFDVWNKFEGIYQILPQVLLTILFEDRKSEKLAAFCRGIRDGIDMPVMKYESHNR